MFLAEAQGQIRSRQAQFTVLNLSALLRGVEKLAHTAIEPFAYGDDLFVFEKVPAMKKSGKFTMKQMLEDDDVMGEVFLWAEQSNGISSSDIEWLLSFAVGAGILSGTNFVVHIDEKRRR